MFTIFQTSYIIIFLVPRHPHIPILSMDQDFPANHLSGAARQEPRSQLFQNHSQRNQHQVWSSRVTRQDLQPSSHDSSVTMTCWCQSSVIYPMTWGGAPSSSSQQPGPASMRRWALVIKRGWRLHTREERTRLRPTDCSDSTPSSDAREMMTSFPRQVGKAQIVPIAGNTFQLRRQWGVE